METLAIKYRPQAWDDVTEQDGIKIILKQQLDTNTIKNAYLFCGGAGTGKTTCARIFAKEINNGKGAPIEMDAASNSGVDNVLDIGQKARLKSINGKYKVFIIDEAHSISNTGWQAFLKLLEEPPVDTIFIFCTTDPQKIPKTIRSRVQRYDFRRISQAGIVERLESILAAEGNDIAIEYDQEAIEYIAKLAEGGMRDAITLMDKCLSFSSNLTIENVVKALGTVDYEVMKQLTDYILTEDTANALNVVETVYADGKDIKQFISQYVQFLLDIQKYDLTHDFKFVQIPGTAENKKWLNTIFSGEKIFICLDLLRKLVSFNLKVKWSQSAKYDLEAEILLFIMQGVTE